ncbi:MAG: hypothetical protein V4692_00605, partial [Bdellovibrionota bacterium]
MRAKQADLFKSKSEFGPNRVEWGGADAKGRDRRIGQRKLQRPFDKKKPISITMKSSQAKARYSMNTPKNKLKIESLIQAKAKKSKAKIHRFAN